MTTPTARSDAPLPPQDTESQAAARLRAAFQRVPTPMLIVDDRRRCVAANAPACALLGIEPDDVPWRRIDDFTSAADRERLDQQWDEFLAHGAIEGWYRLPLPTGRTVPVEFSATANVLPGRHLSVVMPLSGDGPAADPDEEVRVRPGRTTAGPGESGWTRVLPRDPDQLPLTDREREVLGLVAGGLRGSGIAQHLVLSPETIKSHVQNAMVKFGAHTRAHAVAIGLTTGQIESVAPKGERL